MDDLNLGIPFSLDLAVDASNVTVSNTDNASIMENYLTWRWLCPFDFDCSSITTDSKRFEITNQ
jgi:hypothetical protein